MSVTLKDWLQMEPRKKKWFEELFEVEKAAGYAWQREHPPPVPEEKR